VKVPNQTESKGEEAASSPGEKRAVSGGEGPLLEEEEK